MKPNLELNDLDRRLLRTFFLNAEKDLGDENVQVRNELIMFPGLRSSKTLRIKK